MTNTKLTRRALLSSVLALVLCFTMLLGTTFAWFTDEAVSGGNKIVAGNLDVQLLLGDGSGDVDNYIDISADKDPIFGINEEESLRTANNNNADTLWEPGKTQVAYLAIKNNGNLALKYQVSLNVVNPDGGKNLYEVMQYAITPDAKTLAEAGAWNAANAKEVNVGSQIVSDGAGVLAKGETHYFALSIHMDENADNTYKGGQVTFDLTVLATQNTVESDSFDNLYDADAWSWSDVAEPVTPDEDGVVYVYTAQQLAGVAANLTGVKTIEIMENIDLGGRLWTPIDINSGNSLTINGNGHTISNMTINDKTAGSNMKTYGTGFVGNLYAGSLTMNNLTFANANVTTDGSFAGVAVGYAYYGTPYLNNVDVVNSTVASTAEKGIRVGALMGVEFLFDGAEKPTAEGFSVVDCDASGNTIIGYHNVGGLIGSVLYGTKKTNDNIKNCTVSDTTLIHTNPHNWATNALACDGKNAVTDDDFVATNVISLARVSNSDDLAIAVAEAEDGDVIEIIADIADTAITVDKSLTITGDKTLNNVSITASGTNVELTVSGLNFTGSSYINANDAAALTVTNVTADVDPTKITGRAAFIVLGTGEPTHGLKLTVTNNTIKSAQGSADPYSTAIFGWRYIADGSEISNNVFGTENDRYNFVAVKTMNAMDGAVITIKNNTVYGTNKNWYYKAFDLYQNCSRDNAYTVMSGNNVINTEVVEGDYTAVAFYLEDNNDTGSNVTLLDNGTTVNGNALTLSDISNTIANYDKYYGVNVTVDENGKLTGGTYSTDVSAYCADGYTCVDNTVVAE